MQGIWKQKDGRIQITQSGIVPDFSWGIADDIIGSFGWTNASELWRVSGKRILISQFRPPSHGSPRQAPGEPLQTSCLPLRPWHRLLGVAAAPPNRLVVVGFADQSDTLLSFRLWTLPNGPWEDEAVQVPLRSVHGMTWQCDRLWVLGSSESQEEGECVSWLYEWSPGTTPTSVSVLGTPYIIAVSDTGAVGVATSQGLRLWGKDSQPIHIPGKWSCLAWVGGGLLGMREGEGGLHWLSLRGDLLGTVPLPVGPEGGRVSLAPGPGGTVVGLLGPSLFLARVDGGAVTVVRRWQCSSSLRSVAVTGNRLGTALLVAMVTAEGAALSGKRGLLASGGLDKTVRLWDVMHYVPMGTYRFDEPPIALAFHPLGNLLAITFSSDLQIGVPTLGGFIVEHSLPLKMCRLVAFSHGGHLLAVGHGSHVVLLQVPQYQVLGTLKGVALLRSMDFSADDLFLATAAADGRVMEWNISSLSADPTSPERRVWQALSYTSDHSLLLSSSESVQMRRRGELLHEFPVVPSESFQQMKWVHFPVGIEGTGGTIFGGTSEGTLRVMALSQLQGDTLGASKAVAMETVLHEGPVTAFAVSECASFAVTGGEDGSLFLFRLSSDPPKLSLGGTIIVSWEQWRAQERKMQESEAALAAARAEGLATLQRERAEWRERLRVAEAAAEAPTPSPAVPTVLTSSPSLIEREALRAMEEMEIQFQKKLSEANSRVESLKTAKEDLQFHLEETVRSLTLAHQRTLEEERKTWEAKAREDAEKFEKLKREVEFLRVEYEEQIEQEEEEHNAEVTQSQEKINRTLQIERDSAQSLKGDNAMLRRKWESLQLAYETLQNQMFEKDKEVLKMKRRVQELEEAAEGMRKEIDERNFTISQKEHRIVEIKHRNQELEKYRFVSDFRMNELKDELNPKELLIVELRGQIKDMDEELQRTVHSNNQLELAVGERNLKIDALQKEVRHLRHQLGEKEKLTKLFVEDLHNVYTQKDSSEWRAGLKQMYQSYVTQDSRRRITKEDRERMQGKHDSPVSLQQSYNDNANTWKTLSVS